MEAKVRHDYRWSTFQAFSGREYVKYEFRPVPEWAEAAARADESLEVREAPVKAVKSDIVSETPIVKAPRLRHKRVKLVDEQLPPEQEVEVEDETIRAA